MDNLQNINSVETNMPSRLMVKDLSDAYIGKDQVTHARNAVLHSHQGDTYFYSTEPANLECITLPYFYNGSVSLLNNRFMIFSTDNTNSEIGIFDERLCTYTTVVNNQCLGFNRDHPVMGRSKINIASPDSCQEVVTFTDGLNNIRRLDLGNIPYTYTIADGACQTKTYTDTLDCTQLDLFRQIAIPDATLQNVPSGALSNGSYQVVMAYYVDNTKYSDYYSLSLPQFVFDQSGIGGGISATFSNLDQNFLQYAVILLATIKGTTTAYQVGIFSTSQATVSISEIRAEYTVVPLSTLVISKINYQTAGIISGNARYLMLADLTRKPRLNYQQQAMQITAKYVVQQFPLDYYEQFGDQIGYYRNENYLPYIRFIYGDGEPTESFPIPGRKAQGDDTTAVTGDDIYEYDSTTNLPPPPHVYKWQVYNTAGVMQVQNNVFVNNTRVYATGTFAYAESTVPYPDNPIYGEDACTPIRLFRFPDESIVPRYSTVNDQVYINALGFQFDNITYPLDENGNPVPNIIGYEIFRADRAGGNRTIIARGLMTNVRSYTETAGGLSQEVQYSNYPYNDLRPDTFFSSNPISNSGNNEAGYVAPSTVYYDQYNFYSPHCYFNNKYRLGREFDIESEEIGSVTGYFEPVYQHPKEKLLTNFSLYFAILAGVIEGYMSVNGKKTITYQYSNVDNGISDTGGIVQGTGLLGISAATAGEISTIPGSVAMPSLFPTAVVQQADSVFTLLNIPKGISLIAATERVLVNVLKALVAVGAFIYASAEYASAAIKIIMGFCGFQQYAYQYVSHGSFQAQAPSKPQTGNKRRYALQQPQYLPSAVSTVNNNTFNNFGKQESVYVQFNKPINQPTIQDNTRNTISTFGTASSPGTKVTSTSSCWYATSKQTVPDQYGEVDSSTKVKTTNSIIPISGQGPFQSPVIFGGDCIIARFTVLTKQPIFQQDIAGANFPDGTEYNYSLYRNIGYPRFWFDSTFWTIGDLISKTPSLGNLPNTKFNLDGTGNAGSTTAWTVQNRYMYLYINGVLDFIVEADYNIAFRQQTLGRYFYSDQSSNLTEIFRSDRIKQPELFTLDLSYSKLQADQIYSETQPIDYNPQIDEQCKVHLPNSLIYSLPAFVGTASDSWEYFLPGNFYTFDQNDFGNLTTIKQLDQSRVIFLFDKSSPYVSFGTDELQTTDGRKLTIGDGGLFARPPRELQHTDVAYGNSKSRFAFVSTQYGAIYPSFSQGRIFNFTGQLDEISQQGIHYWCQQYMPIMLYKAFPTYPQNENPYYRVGYQTFFDNSSKTIYISKKDYIPNPNITGIVYDPISDQFLWNSVKIQLTDTNYFTDVSWTLSYSPELKGFISYHDWHPDGIIQTENHFITVQGQTLWKHNERCDLYANFYGVDYPFEVEVSSTTGQLVNVLNSLEYILEAYVFKNSCMDRFQVPNANFDMMVVHNSQQTSGPLSPVLASDNPYLNIGYPQFNGNGYNILFDREEQKIRTAQFDDITRDQGTYSGNQFALWFSHPSGYKRIVNPGAIDFTKPAGQRKSFRHYTNRVWLAKTVSGAIKIIVKYINLKITHSPR